MTGYATDETPECMPLTHVLCGKLVKRLEECRRKSILPWVRPDGKVQVAVEYSKKGNILTPIRIASILISCQHDPQVTQSQIESDL
jgi:S-adenosylmethionine synthetase